MPSKVPTSLYFVIIFLIILEISVLMPNRVDISPSETESGHVYKEADLHIEGFELTETRSKDIFWTLNADRALLFRAYDLGVLSDINGEIVDGKHQVSMTGKQGLIFISEKSLLLLDNVQAVTEEGYRLLSDYLWYDGKEQFFRTSSSVKLAGPNPEVPTIELTGQGLYSSLKKQSHEILSRVNAQQNFLNEPKLSITSDTGILDTENKLATFDKDVVISKGDLKISSDKFRVKYLSSRDVEWASATGNVNINERDWRGTCKEAVLLGRDKFVQMRGDAILTRGDDVVRGEVITIDRVGKRIVIEKVSAKLEPPKGI